MANPMSRGRGRGHSEVIARQTIAYDNVPYEKAPVIKTSVDKSPERAAKNCLPKITLVQSVIDDYAENRKHPVATVYELYAKNRLRDEVEFVECHPGSGSALYKCWYQCIISGVKFKPASGNSQKEAKERAGRVVLDHLLNKQNGLADEADHERNDKISHSELAKAALDKLEDIAFKNPSFSIELLRQDCAVFLRSKKLHNSFDVEVVSLGCGFTERVLKETQTGVRDCKALSLARRGLIRYLQNEIRKYCFNPNNSILEMIENDQLIFQVGELHQFHLVLFQPPEIENYQSYEEMIPIDSTENAKFNSYEHPENFELLMENVKFNHVGKEYQKLNYSCNKLLKWNHVGLLGSKMSGYIKSVFLESITAQTSPQLMAFAACCRSKSPIHHPRIGEDDLLYTFVRYQQPIPTSVCWSKGFKDSDDVEALYTETGQNFTGKNDVSLLSNFAFEKRVDKTIESAVENNCMEVCHLLRNPNRIQMRDYQISVEKYKESINYM